MRPFAYPARIAIMYERSFENRRGHAAKGMMHDTISDLRLMDYSGLGVGNTEAMVGPGAICANGQLFMQCEQVVF